MATLPNNQRFYPQHAADKPVDPNALNNNLRYVMDQVYDSHSAIAQIASGGGTAIATIDTVSQQVNGIIVAFPGIGYKAAPSVSIQGGGGSGATATAVITNGRISAITLTSGGSGYTSAPLVTLSN